MPSAARPEVREFFESYERASGAMDAEALAQCFADQFLSLDASSAHALTPPALVAALPRRKALFESIGSDGLELDQLEETPLDDDHTLVRTSWILRLRKAPREPMSLTSTFVLPSCAGCLADRLLSEPSGYVEAVQQPGHTSGMTRSASDLTIRPAAAGEAQRLTELVRRSKAHWGYSAEFLEQAAAELAVPEHEISEGKVSVAELDNRPVGISVLDLGDPPELVALFVEPELIGKGVGRVLLRHELERARGAGVESVLIESDPNAEPFYRAHGAVPIGHRTSPTTGRDLTLLRLDNDFADGEVSAADRRKISQAP